MNYQILQGDCLEMLRTLPDESVQCCVTSPPYYGLRDYGTADWEGGDPGCDHAVGRFTTPASDKQTSNNGSGIMQARASCPKCGAVRVDQQIGLEETPEQYVAALVAVFREVRRVLRADGTLWLNLGDSYNSAASGQNGQSGTLAGGKPCDGNGTTSGRRPLFAGLKPKDLIGIPWRVAFALQADGWWLRQDIIWSKPNPMPESVTDRCTKAHEYVFLLSKSARYYYDAAAVAEASVYPEDDRVAGIRPGSATYPTRNRRSVWTITTKPYSGAHFATMPPDLAELCILAGCPAGGTVLDPFSGSGTTVSVAISLGRAGIGIELNPAYVELSHNRIGATQPALLGV